MKKFIKSFGALVVLPVALSSVAIYFVYMWRFAVTSFTDYWSFWAGIVIAPVVIFKVFQNLASRVYVIEHELTHALFALLSGARVKKISIKKDNGSVVVDKANTLITLAPYFFPLFAISAFIIWLVIFNFALKKPTLFPEYWKWLVYFVVAAALSFHFFMSLRAILEGQSDIKRDGAVYSLTVIFILYVLLSALFMKSLFGTASGFATLGNFFSDIWAMSLKIYTFIFHFLKNDIYPGLKKFFSEIIIK